MSHAPPRLPSRDPGGHKGTFGTVAVVGGACTEEARMIGAPALAAIGALRAGAGLARLYMPEPVLTAGMAACPSATGAPIPVDEDGGYLAGDAPRVFDAALDSCDALVIGPGMGSGKTEQDLALRAVAQERVPVVVDADAINNLAAVPDLHRDFRARAVLTPHPGEFARLAGALRIPFQPGRPESRAPGAQAAAQRLGCIVVLKGAATVVSDGQQTWVCERGHCCLATAGTGDVLAGVIAGVIAQHGVARAGAPGPLPLLDCTKAAVLAHALAAETWAAAHRASGGMLAAELAAIIPECLETLRA